MKLRKLELLRFGKLRDVSIPLAAERPFHVIYGGNEAGKSTTKRALVALLYGIENQDNDASIFKADTSVAGTFDTEAGPLRLTRYKKLKPPFVVCDDGADGESLIAQLRRGLDKEAFSRSFALDHEGLRAFANALTHGGPLAALATAELGGVDVGAIERMLKEASEDLAADTFLQSKKRKIAQQLAELKRVTDELDATSVSPGAVQLALEEVEKQRLEFAQLQHRDLQIHERLRRADEWLRLGDDMRRLEAKRAEMVSFELASTVSEEGASRAHSLDAALARIDAELLRRREELHELRTRASALEPNLAQLEHAKSLAAHAPRLDDAADSAAAWLEAELAARDADARLLRANTELEALGLGSDLPVDAGWMQLLASWVIAAADLVRHRAEAPPRSDAARVYSEDDRLALEEALARAEAAFDRSASEMHIAAVARAQADWDSLQGAFATANDGAFDLPAARQLRDQKIRARYEQGASANAAELGAWLAAAAEVDEKTDLLLKQAVAGARHTEALRAASDALARARSQAEEHQRIARTKLSELRTALTSLDVRLPASDNADATIARAREASSKLKKAIDAAVEAARYRASWVAKDRSLEDALRGLDERALKDWGVSLGAKTWGIATAVRDACKARTEAYASARQLTMSAETKRQQLLRKIEFIGSLQPSEHEDAKVYVRRFDEARRTAAICVDEAAEHAKLLRAAASLSDEVQLLAGERERVAEEQHALLSLFLVDDLPALVAARRRTLARQALEHEVKTLEDAIARDAERIEVSMAEVATADVSAVQARNLALEERALVVEQLSSCGRLLRQAESAHEHMMGLGDKAAELEQTRAYVSAELDGMLSRYVTLRASRALLRGTLAAHRDARLAPLLQATSKYLRILTANAYDSVALDESEDSLGLCVRSGDGPTISVALLSDGTRDQLGMATRLAYEELHAADAALPLVLDDVLVHFDNARAAAALQALSELSSKRPLLLLTHHRHVVELAEAHIAHGLLDLVEL